MTITEIRNYKIQVTDKKKLRKKEEENFTDLCNGIIKFQ